MAAGRNVTAMNSPILQLEPTTEYSNVTPISDFSTTGHLLVIINPIEKNIREFHIERRSVLNPEFVFLTAGHK